MWIKERESSHNLQVVRMGVPSTVTVMERAMEAGHSVLIENMGENIDAVLNPVITRSTFKKVSFLVPSFTHDQHLLHNCVGAMLTANALE